ncbi:MAG: hypothetical protein IPN29_05445 [Saprospiraceae bacterium]|nr:hypothetical protein [Saprospiraceae bacterium]
MTTVIVIVARAVHFCNMYRPLLAKSLFIIFTLTLSPVREMVKIPFAILHYFDHESKLSGESLIRFVRQHYTNPIKDSDYLKDIQLPFKSGQDSGTQFNLMVVSIDILGNQTEVPASRSERIGYLVQLPSMRENNRIFHPPK